ncbi:MAG: 3'-5' exonuclease [Lamprobacter sp.]|uniref:3'-5' exonuclease n=1 Tax=Lamprobacter sp. TaxID=3100796 RepID=UPI002B262CC1|nr:3'-5' exonuclease [Lamprobacter sp.]MEA3642265.1 3'-5' exonuclease [Lamprobacter sp.]
MQRTLYLDLETTGLDPNRDEILEIGLLDANGQILLDSLVRPEHHRHWIGAQAIHGIRPEDVRDAPTLDSLRPQLIALLTDAEVVIYNAEFEQGFLRAELATAASTHCAMRAFAEVYGEPRSYRGYRWQKLQVAAAYIGYAWPGSAHRAIHDCQATRAIWHWLQQQPEPATAPPGSSDTLALESATRTGALP